MVLTLVSGSSPGFKRPKEPDMINDPRHTDEEKDYGGTTDIVHRHHHGPVSPLPSDACRPHGRKAALASL
jgi:hypothetical protein